MATRLARSSGFLLISILLIVTALSGRCSPSHSQDKSGRVIEHVTVIDGDTLKLDGKLVQLYGIDCPELDRTCVQDGHSWDCGLTAMLHLDKIITLNRGSLECTPWGNQGADASHAEQTFVCKVGHEDLGETLLRGGYCVAVSGAFPDYAEAERSAQEARLGIWGSDFVPPLQRSDGNGRAPVKP